MVSMKFVGKPIPKPNWDLYTPKTSARTLTDSSNKRKIYEIGRTQYVSIIKNKILQIIRCIIQFYAFLGNVAARSAVDDIKKVVEGGKALVKLGKQVWDTLGK